ncbi:retrotransposon protein, putative, ty1-copia subclass [Tanacetum coccineum]
MTCLDRSCSTIHESSKTITGEGESVEWNAVYDAHNEVACLMLGSMTPELHGQLKNSSPYEMLQGIKFIIEKQAGVERFDLIQTFHAYKQEEGTPVGPYVIKMENYVAQLERLGYVLSQDLSVGLILNGLTNDFVGFNLEIQKKSLNAEGKGKEKGKGKDKSYIPKPKNPKPSAKEHSTKDDACHQCKEVGHWKRNCHVYLTELIKKKKKVNTASYSDIFTIELFSFPNKSWVNKRANHNLDSTFLWHYRLAHISKKRIEKMQQDGLLKSTDEESFDQCVSCLTGKMTRKPFPHRTERATDLLGIIHTDVWGCEALVKRDTLDKLQQRSVKCFFIGYPNETTGYYFYFPPENKFFVTRYVEFLKKNLFSQEISRRVVEVEEIQDEDASPSENTSKIPMEVKGFEPPQVIFNINYVLYLHV